MKRDKAEEALKAQTRRVEKAKKKVEKELAKMPDVVLDAFESGIRRNEIERITRYSNPRIGQWLAEARRKRYPS